MIDLIIKAETEGVTEEEAIELAAYYVHTGLVHSTGSLGRFVEAVASEFPAEFAAAVAK